MSDSVIDRLTTTTRAEAEELATLHARLVETASGQGLVDAAYRTLDTPVGSLLVACTDAGIVRVAYATEGHEQVLESLGSTIGSRILRDDRRFDEACRQLDAYFEGRLDRFDLTLDLRLAHGFRLEVLEHLRAIPYGTTASYGAVATASGRPRAVRAVGTACATNPLPVLVPCHRVVRADGTLGGYLGGLSAKQFLLDLESAA